MLFIVVIDANILSVDKRSYLIHDHGRRMSVYSDLFTGDYVGTYSIGERRRSVRHFWEVIGPKERVIVK